MYTRHPSSKIPTIATQLQVDYFYYSSSPEIKLKEALSAALADPGKLVGDANSEDDFYSEDDTRQSDNGQGKRPYMDSEIDSNKNKHINNGASKIEKTYSTLSTKQ